MKNDMVSRLLCLFCWMAVVLFGWFASTEPLGSQETGSRESFMSDPELLKGVNAYMNGDYEGCYRLFRGVYGKKPGLSPPGVLMAQLFSSDGKYIKMHEYLEKAAVDDSDDPETFFQLGQIALREGRFVECRLLIEKGTAVLERLAQSDRGKEQAFGLRLRELTRQLYCLQANYAQARHDFVGAEGFIRKVLDNGPDDSEAWTSLGFLLFKQGKNDQASEAFAKAHMLDSSLSSDWLVLAQLLQHEGKSDEAKKLVQSRFDTKTITPGELARLIRLYTRWGQFDDAEKLTRTILKENPNSVAAWTLLGELSLYRSDFVAAEDQFRKAVLIESGDFDATNGMALAMGDQRNRQKLVEAYAIAKTNWEHNPALPEAVATYAWMLYLLGQRDEAERLFSPMLEKGEITSTIAYYLAEIANSKGAPALALNFLDLALEKEACFPKRSAAIELRDLIEKKK